MQFGQGLAHSSHISRIGQIRRRSIGVLVARDQSSVVLVDGDICDKARADREWPAHAGIEVGERGDDIDAHLDVDSFDQ